MKSLLEKVGKLIKERDITLRVSFDEDGWTIVEWPSCCVRATSDISLEDALIQYSKTKKLR